VQRQRAYVCGGLQPGAALVGVRLAVVTLPPRSTAPAVAGCRLVACKVVSGRPLRSRAVLWLGCRSTSGSVWVLFWPPVPRPRLRPPRPPGGVWVVFPLRGGVCAEKDRVGVVGRDEEGGSVRSGPGEARTILLLHIIGARPSKQPLMVRTFLKVYMELGFYFVSARTNKRHQHWSRSTSDVRNGTLQCRACTHEGKDAKTHECADQKARRFMVRDAAPDSDPGVSPSDRRPPETRQKFFFATRANNQL
jgi:hypothetical protein